MWSASYHCVAGNLNALADQHQIYQQQVVAKELLNLQEGVVYKVPLGVGKLKCPFPLCKGGLASGWMMRRHFRDLHLHLLDYVLVKKEGRYPQCPHCNMQVDPRVPTSDAYQHQGV